MLDAKRNNFLAAIYAGREGRLRLRVRRSHDRRFPPHRTRRRQGTRRRTRPRAARRSARRARSRPRSSATCRGLVARDGYTFLPDQAYFTLREHFKVQSLDGFGCDGHARGDRRGGRDPALPEDRTAPLARRTSRGWRCYRNSQFMVLDAATQANLELVAGPRRRARHALLGALDRTVTPMGARKLRDWILHPLCDLAALNAAPADDRRLARRAVPARQSARNAQVHPRHRAHRRPAHADRRQRARPAGAAHVAGANPAAPRRSRGALHRRQARAACRRRHADDSRPASAGTVRSPKSSPRPPSRCPHIVDLLAKAHRR